ncbi:LysR substrate-binding domain-containing protein [Variovorax ginsengisoli]|jgi:DNA-binding transcriptional LysR family regulator|uniref:LysR substrate-binding domain-containing protein n=1 Tax=Variovorax ginsengisoli TaxID=363844 RepID=A0ABT8S6T2_9BURK|nr:LysR substrate-binding domain-containing protein [Variovorax ginsengisoli]MDN8615456.1 LysR substrate-binding domain-containing protein [Variovorax ginsengisoli]MDO1534626.1 LysR substrate-binding domain-containing protein [Variovorax ginsengisoli]
MKPNQLLAFVAVAEQMSIRGAARTLGLSQPAVTKIVRELEREVGAPLVERSVKGVSLTPYGEAFAPRARLLLADMRRARDEIAQIRDGATGKVAVAVSTSVALTILPAAFKAYHARLPAVDVHFSEAVLPWMLARLRDGQLDLAVAHVIPGTLDAEFETIDLFPVHLAVGVRDGHPLGGAKSLRELHAAEWVLPGDGELGREVVAPLFSPIGLTAPPRVILGASVTVALGLVGHMDLVGLFVEPLVELAFRHHSIRRVAIREQLPPLHVCVVKLRSHRLTPAAQHFVECVQLAARAKAASQA